VNANSKKVMVFGTFDLIHPGHVYMLEQAKKYGDCLVVVVARDSTVKKVKNFVPHHDEQMRKSMIEKLGVADRVILGNAGDKFQVIRDENPQVIALGYDQVSLVDNLQDKVGKSVAIIRLPPFKPEHYKSSQLRKRIVPPVPVTN
jgi:cytidyltransferase-like protein